MPEIAIKCIDSWKKFLPDYEIVEWNEKNFDIHQCKYIEQAYNAKKWGFVSDYARLKIIYENGGFYLDTDVEVIKSFDPLLNENGILGFESIDKVNSGNIVAAEKNCQLLKELYETYEKIPFLNDDGSFNLKPCPIYNTEILKQHGLIQNNSLQKVCKITIFPTEYFCPKDFYTGKINLTENTYSIHHMDGSWLTNAHRKHIYNLRKYHAKYPRVIANLFGIVDYVIYQLKDKGFIEIIKLLLLKK